MMQRSAPSEAVAARTRRGEALLVEQFRPGWWRGWHPQWSWVTVRVVAPADLAAVRDGAKLMASLSHPTIPRVLRTDVIDREVVTVFERFRPGPPPADPVSFLGELADGLAYLHGRGVAHGRLGPETVWCTPEGSPRIVEFFVDPKATPRADIEAFGRLAVKLGAPTLAKRGADGSELAAQMPSRPSATNLQRLTMAMLDGLIERPVRKISQIAHEYGASAKCKLDDVLGEGGPPPASLKSISTEGPAAAPAPPPPPADEEADELLAEDAEPKPEAPKEKKSIFGRLSDAIKGKPRKAAAPRAQGAPERKREEETKALLDLASGSTTPAEPTATEPGAVPGIAPTAREFEERYELRECAHVGGMGEIWRAWDKRMEREIAAKLMRPEFASRPSARDQFLKETKLQGRLMHPAIPPVFDQGITADGLPFFTTRYVEGRSLQKVLDGVHVARRLGVAPLSLPRLVRIFLGVCEGVGFAHSRGVLHCDLKPDNVLLSQFYEVFVVDWGLAKLTNAPENYERYASLYDADQRQIGITAVVRVGDERRVVIGTPGYMAAEQAHGAWEEFDETTDVAGLGAILYSVLTGEPPFCSPGEARELAVLRSRRGELTPLRTHNPAVPAELERVCVRSLSREKGARYATVEAMKTEVAAWLEATSR
jgi:serine/threonine protein kinase